MTHQILVDGQPIAAVDTLATAAVMMLCALNGGTLDVILSKATEEAMTRFYIGPAGEVSLHASVTPPSLDAEGREIPGTMSFRLLDSMPEVSAGYRTTMEPQRPMPVHLDGDLQGSPLSPAEAELAPQEPSREH